ncbi:BC1872 family protein [Paenibacillus wynnii]|uniref:Phage ABA sandwich domain-containing protein n=1 Tax=Paenibacillus wynnii TaxID=268407 RepID=A0A098MDH0_9BACL|nr:hypothetical protein [Paenibacillus wynnii]KGE20609.1 hypothetical protein PWYN_15605 [Paenibacillus wynnii]
MTVMTLTREEILNQPAGQILNQWVAVNIMCFDPGVVQYGDWCPSEDISAAWEVEEKIKEMAKDEPLHIGYYMTELILIVGSNGFNMIHATPEQRCKAALLAVLNL